MLRCVAFAAGVQVPRAPKLLYLCKSYPEKILSVLRCVAFAAGVQVPRVPYMCRDPSGGDSQLLPGYVCSAWFWGYMLGKFLNPLKISKQRVQLLGPKLPLVFLPQSIPAAPLAIMWFGGEKFNVRSC